LALDHSCWRTWLLKVDTSKRDLPSFNSSRMEDGSMLLLIHLSLTIKPKNNRFMAIARNRMSSGLHSWRKRTLSFMVAMRHYMEDPLLKAWLTWQEAFQ
jgi:hypothetical protein